MAPWKKLENAFYYISTIRKFLLCGECPVPHTAPNCVQIAAKIHKIPDNGNTDSVLKSVTTFRSMVLGNSLMKKKNELPFFFSVNFFDI